MRKIYLKIKKELIIPLFLIMVGAISFGNTMAQGDSLLSHWDFVDQGEILCTMLVAMALIPMPPK